MEDISKKKCTRCGHIFPASTKFFVIDRRGKDGLYSQCKECDKEYRKRNKNKLRNEQLRIKYGISNKIYNKWLKEQKNRCKICGININKLRRRLVVDHNHKTGENRGLICDSCNKGIGHFRDNPFILIKTINYLKNK